MKPECLVLSVEAARFTEDMVGSIKEILVEHAGDVPVQLRLCDNGEDAHLVRLGELYSVNTGGDIIARLKSLLGDASVILKYPEM